MSDDPNRHHRQSIRLRGYDYTQAGAYFVTIVAHERACLFGEIVDDVMHLNDLGHAVAEDWQQLAHRFPRAECDVSIVMPNHLHGIIVLAGRGEASAGSSSIITGISAADASPLRPTGTVAGSLGALIQNFKSTSTRRINALRQTPGGRVWQRNYFEHIIRNERDLNRIREYIIYNPLKWALDSEYPGVQ